MGRKGRVFTLISNGSEPGMVAVFEGTMPAQTRPYSYGNNYLKIIKQPGSCGATGKLPILVRSREPAPLPP